MESSRFINQLRLLSPAQFRRFVSFVQSPYHNQSDKLNRLIDHIAGVAPDFRGPLMEKEVIFRAIVEEQEEYEAQKVFNQMSRLRQLWERFLMLEQLERDERTQELLLLGSLEQWGMDEYLSRSYARISDQQERSQHRDLSYYQHQHQLLAYAETGSKHQRRGMSASVLQRMEAIDLYYLTAKLKYSCEWLNRQHISNLSGTAQLTDSLLAELAEATHPYRQVAAVSIYYQILMTFREAGKEVHFLTLLQLLELHRGQFDTVELGDMYGYAQNYCIRKINEGNDDYFEQLLEIYKRQLETGTLIREGVLPHEHYKNITTVGLRLGQYQWVRSFLETWRQELHPDFEENAYTYNLSVYYYEQQQYPNAMKLLQKVSFSDVYYDLSARSMLLKIYYETGDMDSLRYHLEAFMAFLKRNQSISGLHLRNHKALIRHSKKLMRLRRSRGVAQPASYLHRWQELHDALQTARGVPNLSWLQQQCARLSP